MTRDRKLEDKGKDGEVRETEGGGKKKEICRERKREIERERESRRRWREKLQSRIFVRLNTFILNSRMMLLHKSVAYL